MSKRKFYVYLLCRPDNSVFYVGKGRDYRIDRHEVEARSGVQSPKCDVIREVWQSGGQIIKKKIFETDNEAEEYAEEVRQVSIHNFENLTNRTNGGGGVKALTFEEDIEQTICNCRFCAQTPEIAEYLAYQRDF